MDIRTLNREVIMLVLDVNDERRGRLNLRGHPSLPVSYVVERAGVAAEFAADVL
jgi:hypothetical protein